MALRRSIVWIVSAIVGLVSTVATIVAFGTTLERFTLAGALLVFLSIGSFVFIWLDWLFRTDYLKS